MPCVTRSACLAGSVPAGWRLAWHDPGHGGTVTNAHVAVAAACNAADAAPIEGSFYGTGASSSLEYALGIRTRN